MCVYIYIGVRGPSTGPSLDPFIGVGARGGSQSGERLSVAACWGLGLSGLGFRV